MDEIKRAQDLQSLLQNRAVNAKPSIEVLIQESIKRYLFSKANFSPVELSIIVRLNNQKINVSSKPIIKTFIQLHQKDILNYLNNDLITQSDSSVKDNNNKLFITIE